MTRTELHAKLAEIFGGTCNVYVSVYTNGIECDVYDRPLTFKNLHDIAAFIGTDSINVKPNGVRDESKAICGYFVLEFPGLELDKEKD